MEVPNNRRRNMKSASEVISGVEEGSRGSSGARDKREEGDGR